MRHALALALLTIGAPLSGAPVIQSVTPASAPATGGTEVTIRGTFDATQAVVVEFGFDRIGFERAASARLVDATTIVAVTPDHYPTLSAVRVIQGGMPSNVQGFVFTGEVPASFERILLPVFTPPTDGAFGSQFLARLRMWNKNPGGSSIRVWGLPLDVICDVVCPLTFPVFLQPNGVESDRFGAFHVPAAPGFFIHVPRVQVKDVSMSLRVYDTSRDAQNFGTEIPVVHEDDFFTAGQGITLLGIPIDPRFRNTLRVYSTEATTVRVTIGSEQRVVGLTRITEPFAAAYAAIGDFPAGSGTVRVLIEGEDENHPPLWAFVSVTNNETQTITTITPQR